MTTGMLLARRAMLAGACSALAPIGAAHGAPPFRGRIADANQPRATTMNIIRSGSQPSTKGSEDYFTGAVRIDSPFKGSGAARIGGAFVTFEPGARTAWHTHPLGQTLIVTSGCGWVQAAGSGKEQIRAGDVIWIPPGERHWHGATATTAMTHIAIGEALDGQTVNWMEKVSDAQYDGQ
jgi:quercetin dioxygenase-like cupin family protein